MATADIQVRSIEHNPKLAIVGDGTGDYVDSVSAHNGTAVNNIYLDKQFSDVTSELKRLAVVVGDDISISVTGGNVYHIVRVEA